MLSGESGSASVAKVSVAPKILTFHKIQSGLSFGVSNCAPRKFANLLNDLESRGYSFRSLADVLSDPSTKSISLTFDDGYQHLVSTLTPLMEEHQLRPTIFMPTGWIGKPNRWDYSNFLRNEPHLDISQIKQLAELGVKFGSHGHSHSDLTSMSAGKLKQELTESKDTIEQITGQTVDQIAYPFGRVDQRVTESAAEVGYKFGFTTAFPEPDNDSLAMGRYPVYSFDNPTTIRQKLGQNGMSSIHRTVSNLSTFLSGGTVLLNRLRRNADRS